MTYCVMGSITELGDGTKRIEVWVHSKISYISHLKMQAFVSCVQVIIVIHGRPPVAVSAAMHNLIGRI